MLLPLIKITRFSALDNVNALVTV